jgi:prepilin-type N-terminal cleavage/methylation domain-containing protein
VLKRFRERSWRSQGFTLIELLIVIAIILILIAIALPNFLEAQTRARVTKAKGEMRSLGIAQEAYFQDWKMYPTEHERDTITRLQLGLFWLTSPIKYIGSIPQDPFTSFGADEAAGFRNPTYETGGIERGKLPCNICMVTYVIFSNGPDHQQSMNASSAHCCQTIFNYSPTNGTNSSGDLRYWGGDGFWIGVGSTSTLAGPNAPLAPLTNDNEVYVHRLPRY